MDRKSTPAAEIERLIRQSAAARACLANQAAALRQRLDLPARLRSSLKEHPSGWMFGSLASGLAASLLLRRRPSAAPRHRRGLPVMLLGMGFTAARPLLKLWLANQLKRWLSGHTQPAPDATQNPSSRRQLPFQPH